MLPPCSFWCKTLVHLTARLLSSAGPDRGDQEQPEPSLWQGLLAGLLLRGGAEAEIRSVRHPRHAQHRHPRRRLPGRGGVHPGPGGLRLVLINSDLAAGGGASPGAAAWWTAADHFGMLSPLSADSGPEEDDEAFIAQVREICWKIHHHGRSPVSLHSGAPVYRTS